MIQKEFILKTVICYWSSDDQCYVAESPFFPAVIAAEETPEKALKVYKSMLDSAYEELLKDDVHGFKDGKPTKNRVELNVEVQPDTKEMLEEIGKNIGISQGEFIDLMTFYYVKKAQPGVFGCMKGSMQITGDIISPIDVEWEAND